MAIHRSLPRPIIANKPARFSNLSSATRPTFWWAASSLCYIERKGAEIVIPGDMLELRSGPEDVIGMSLLSSTAVCAFRLADCSAIVTVDKLRVTSDNRPKGDRLLSIKTALETLGVRDDTLTWAERDALDREGF